MNGKADEGRRRWVRLPAKAEDRLPRNLLNYVDYERVQKYVDGEAAEYFRKAFRPKRGGGIKRAAKDDDKRTYIVARLVESDWAGPSAFHGRPWR